MNHPAYCYHSKWQQALETQYDILHVGSQLMEVQQKVMHAKEITFQFSFDVGYVSAFSYRQCQNILAFDKLLILPEEDSSGIL